MMILEREGAKRPEEDDSGARAALFEKVELFSGLSRIVLARIAASLDPVAFADHEAACVQGEPGDSMYIVSSGALGVFLSPDGETETRVAAMGPGACFGEMALLTGEPRSATVRALGGAEAYRLERQRFIDVLRREPGIGLAISATLSRRLRDANQTMTQDKRAISQAVALQLEALDARQRSLVLRASVLEKIRLPALRALFGAQAEEVAGFLSVVGIDAAGEAAPLPVLRALRDMYEREAGAAEKQAYAQQASHLLAEGACWEDALALFWRLGPREAYVETLRRAMHMQVENAESDPSLDPWIARLGADGPVVGVDPWVIIITLLATFSTWFFPSQTVGYLVAYDASKERLFTHGQARRVCFGFTVVLLLSLALTVPYWMLIGLV